MTLPMEFTYYDNYFEIIETQLDNVTEEIGRLFNDFHNLDDNEYSISEINLNVIIETAKEEILLYSSDIRPERKSKETRIKNLKPETVRTDNDHTFRNYTPPNNGDTIEHCIPISRSGTEEKDSLKDIIVIDKNVKIVLQLPTNNKKAGMIHRTLNNLEQPMNEYRGNPESNNHKLRPGRTAKKI